MQLTKDADNADTVLDSLASGVDELERWMIQGVSEKMLPTIFRVLSIENLLALSESGDFDATKDAISSLLDYLEGSFDILSAQVGRQIARSSMIVVWEECIEVLNLLLDAATDPTANVIEKEKTDVVNQWLQTLKKFFHSRQDVPLAMLESAKLREILRRVY